MTALSIPDPGRIGGDWHFVAALCCKNSRIQSAGLRGTLIDTNLFFGNRMIIDKADILRKRGIDLPKIQVFCAQHPRAVADLLYHSLSQNIFPDHIILDGGIFEEEIEFAQLEQLMAFMAPSLKPSQHEKLLRWKNKHFYPLKDGIAA